MLGSCQHWELLHSPHPFLLYLNQLISFSELFRVSVRNQSMQEILGETFLSVLAVDYCVMTLFSYRAWCELPAH